jgi:hypothetical protein
MTMARAKEVPVPNSPARALAAIDADIPVVLRGETLEKAGWTRPDPLTLIIPRLGVRQDGTRDDFLLRLNFLYYPEWPPSAQFVNPNTRGYCYPDDQFWLPRVEGTNEIAIHAQFDAPGGRKIQLICASVTLEFYQILHDVDPKYVWNSQVQNFSATLTAIDRALRQPFYKGRQK